MWSFNLFFLHQALSHVFHEQGFSGSRLFCMGPGPRSRVWIQVLEVADAKQLYYNHFLHGCFPVNVLHIFRTVSHKITSGGLLLNMGTNKRDKADRKIQCNRNYVSSLFGIFISFQYCSYWECKSIKAIKDDLYHKVIGTKCSGNFRSIPPVVFLGKGVLKICSKFTGEHPCRSAISVCKFAAYFQNTFSQEHLWRNASETSN